MAFSALFRRLHRALWLMPSLGGDLGQGDAFEAVAADQLGLGGGQDAAGDGGGQDEVGVAPGHVRGVVAVGQVAAAAA